ncbi:MAG TPA: hypothetical protein VFW88_06130 [Burkholderiales bacterium]|nr:hypothetical protein [Burkholderiales bacterium]
MKKQFKATPLALAVAAAFALSTTAALADRGGPGGGWNDGGQQHEQQDPGASFQTSVKINKSVKIDGEVKVDGRIKVGSDAEAIVNNTQASHDNIGANTGHTNNASGSGDALAGSQGNIGLNIAAGDNNAQSNEAALAATDASQVFGAASAQVFMSQGANRNLTTNLGSVNNASLSGNVLQNAQGNIGANVAAGNSNVQKNVLAAAAADSNFAVSTINQSQDASGNVTVNAPLAVTTVKSMPVSLQVSMRGQYAGVSDQDGNQYLDSWSGALDHPSGNSTGHLDLDDQVQNANDRPQSSGLDANGNPNNDKSNGGALSFNEQGDMFLSGVVSGNMPVSITTYVATANNASLSGNALRGAMGNIGANVAAGSNNLQSNILAVSAALNSGAGGGGGGGETLR